MDIHINDLIIQKGFKDVLLKDVSFRDIDQEFIFVRSSNTFCDGKRNILFYCFIKPYQGLFFRKIGETNERRNQVIVDEDMNLIFRLDGNPDCVRIEVNGIERELKLIRCTEDGIVAEDED